jgi:hypothetical protein
MIYHIYDESPAERFAALLDMVRRKAPELMKQGGLVALAGEVKPLTAAERRRIVEMRKRGMKQAEIARTLGRSPGIVSRVCVAALGPARDWARGPKRVKNIDPAQVMALRAEGHAWEDIALKVGISRQVLRERRKEWAAERVVRVEKAA